MTHVTIRRAAPLEPITYVSSDTPDQAVARAINTALISYLAAVANSYVLRQSSDPLVGLATGSVRDPQTAEPLMSVVAMAAAAAEGN